MYLLRGRRNCVRMYVMYVCSKHSHTHTHTRTHARTRTHAHTTHTHTHTHTHTYTHTRTHNTHTHTRTQHTHTHTHKVSNSSTHLCPPWRPCRVSGGCQWQSSTEPASPYSVQDHKYIHIHTIICTYACTYCTW